MNHKRGGRRVDYRCRILSACSELCFSRGFSSVTVDDLARRAGVSKRTVYRHFTSKEEIIAAVLDDYLERLAGKARAAITVSGEPAELLMGVVRAVLENLRFFSPQVLYDLQRHYPALWAKAERFRFERLREFCDSILAAGGHGDFRGINPEVFIRALQASIQAVVNPAFIIEHNLTPEEAALSVFRIFIAGGGDVMGKPGQP